MRYVAASLLLVAQVVTATRAEEGVTGKAAEWLAWPPAAERRAAPPAVLPERWIIDEETPNARRKRLGHIVEATSPAESYGEALETPNQQRARLGQSVTLETPAEDGVLTETPNQARERLASARLRPK